MHTTNIYHKRRKTAEERVGSLYHIKFFEVCVQYLVCIEYRYGSNLTACEILYVCFFICCMNININGTFALNVKTYYSLAARLNLPHYHGTGWEFCRLPYLI